MKIYLKVKKDNAYCVASLWSKHIKEQILETVKEVSKNWMFEPKLYPMFIKRIRIATLLKQTTNVSSSNG